MFGFLARRQADPRKLLLKVLGEYSLPSFPGTVLETLSRIRDPGSSAGAIAEVLGVDPGLSVRVLNIANSAAYSPTRKVENLTQAVALVGFSQLESLVMSVAVGKALPKTGTPEYDFKRFWQAAACRGTVARELAKLICPARVSECFTAGFLEDLAIPFLANCPNIAYGPVLAKWNAQGGNLATLEREVFDWDHAEVATWICSEWHLPENIASAIGGHHQTEDSSYDCPSPVGLVACLSDRVNESEVKQLVSWAVEHYGQDAARVRQAVEKSLEEAQELARLMT